MSLAWMIWGLGALFYLVAFFQRVAPGVLTHELMRDLQISASGLGHLSALYFYPYVAMQIPTGILADYLGPRKLLTAGCLVAGTGTFIFALSPSFAGAAFGRFLIGISVAVAFVGLLKLSISWFPLRFYSFVAGNSLSIGLLGAIGAGPPLRFLVDYFNWRAVILVTGAMTLVLALLIWLVVRDWPQEKGYPGYTESVPQLKALTFSSICQSLGKVLTYRNTILFLIIPGGIVGAALTFSGLWGVPYLTTHYQLTAGKAANLTASLLIGWAMGGPFFGWLSGYMGKRKPLYQLGSIVVALGWAAILFIHSLGYYQLAIVLWLTGFCSGCIIISFPFVSESVPRTLSGTVSGLINMAIMVGPATLQPLMGRILDNHWTGQMANGVRIYSLQAYEYGFIPMMVWVSISALLMFFTKETNCRQIG